MVSTTRSVTCYKRPKYDHIGAPLCVTGRTIRNGTVPPFAAVSPCVAIRVSVHSTARVLCKTASRDPVRTSALRSTTQRRRSTLHHQRRMAPPCPTRIPDFKSASSCAGRNGFFRLCMHPPCPCRIALRALCERLPESPSSRGLFVLRMRSQMEVVGRELQSGRRIRLAP